MRVAILGMGAIGQVVARALEGRADLVRVDRTRFPLRSGEPPVDAAVVCTKTYGTPWAAGVAAALLAPDGVAVTVQNGLGNLETLAEAVGPARVSLGVIYVGARILPDGSLFATGPGRVELGRPADPAARASLEALGELLAQGGMGVSVVDDARPSVWRKLAVNAAMNPTTAIFGVTNGGLLGHPAAEPLSDALARETARVATAVGVPLSEEEVVAAWRNTAKTLGENRSSMLNDLDVGKPTEIDAINGAVVREAERAGVEAPTNEAITLLVKAVEKKV
ncbi:MAG: 2-dehydropantoate 2-reductase [Chloroflexota bacterium]|nr:2-dehydropantoate 2-reductase [Chloroflexota bacterium]